MRAEQSLDLLAGAAAHEGQPVADRGVLVAGSGILVVMDRKGGVELPVDDGQPPARPQHADPLVDRRLGMRQCPQHMAADDEVEAAR